MSHPLFFHMRQNFLITTVRGKHFLVMTRRSAPGSGWGHAAASEDFSSGLRKSGRDTFRRVIATDCGMSIMQESEKTSLT